MRYLIVNGDDFGHSEAITDGIVRAHTEGILTSTSLMVHAPAAAYAAQLARSLPELSVGLHFTEEPDVDLDDPDQARRALEDQLQRFRQLTGRDPTHVDSHHHVHCDGERLEIFRDVTGRLDVPLRFDGQVGYVGGFYGQWEAGVTDLVHVRRPYLLELIRTEVPEGWTEIACHPGIVTGDLQSSYLEERAVELATLTEPGLRQEIETLGVGLASYHDWRRRA